MHPVRSSSVALSAFVVLAAAAPALGQALSGGAATTSAALQSGAVWAREADGTVLVRATRVARPPQLDGRLDDQTYREVPAITEMIQATPVPGAPGTDRTEAWVLFDDDNIYISLPLLGQDPGAHRGERHAPRQQQHQRGTISFAVAFDTFHDGRNGFIFNVIAGRRPARRPGDRRARTTPTGTASGTAHASRFDGGWIAEMAIPFKSLRYAPGRSQTWDIQIRRVHRRQERDASTSRRCRRQLGIAATNRYVARRHAGRARGAAAGRQPGVQAVRDLRPYDGRSGRAAVCERPRRRRGIRREVRLTQSLTADFTYNTDFAQVEADEQQVNLTRFSIVLSREAGILSRGPGTLRRSAAAAGGDVGGGDAPTIFYTAGASA